MTGNATRSLNSKQMKKLTIYFSVTLAFIAAGCSSDFEALNTDPTKSTPENFDANYFLSNAEWTYADGTSGYNGPILFQSGWVQVLSSTSSGGANYYSNMDKYVSSSNTNSYMASVWTNCYRSASLANEAIEMIEGDADQVNLYAAATIWKIMAFQHITDVYGDAPYTEALQAEEGITLPVYDTQQEIYAKMLSDLDAAVSSFDNSKASPTADILPYDGNIDQWRKFGYSLMLRMAMRLTKVDLATAKLYAEKAYDGGTFESTADDAYIKADYANGYRNDYARDLRTVDDFYQVRFSKTFIDYLDDNDDPRLGVVAEVPPAGLAASSEVGLVGDNDPDLQLGMPNGYELGGTHDITTAPGYPGGTGTDDDVTPIGKYSRPRLLVYGDNSGPLFVLTYAQTELLLAEAAVRGFEVGDDAATHYHNAVKGALLALTPFGADAVISAGDAETFADDSPLDESTDDNSLKMINEQYWATTGSLFIFNEAWTNWRRSGYPELTAVVFPSNFSEGTIPRRQPYPTTEGTQNTANYQAAVGRLTGDKWNEKVWWDQ